jgi:hypothetical protein
MKSVLVVDLATNDQHTHLWNNVQETIALSNDSLKSNYVGLDPKSFVSLPAVIIDNKIVCFSGLQVSQKKWGDGIGRCSARMWIHPEYRFKHITRFTGGNRFLNTTYSLPLQIAAAKIHKLDCLFISRETNLLGFEEYLKLIKINCGVDFILESDQYNVCAPQKTVPESCRQYVAVLHLTDVGPQRWQQHMFGHKIIPS